MSNDDRISEVPLVDAVDGFMRLAGQTTGKFNARQACLYTGLVLEEVGEMIDVIMEGCLTPAQTASLMALGTTLKMYASSFKSGLHEGDILRCNHADLIDAQFDTAWVAIGGLMSTAINPDEAIAHGTFTNLDKFRDGKCERDVNGKVKKPFDWRGPDFSPYVDPLPRV